MRCDCTVLTTVGTYAPLTTPQDAAADLSAYLQSECDLFYDEADRLVFEANKALPKALANREQVPTYTYI